MTKRAFLLSILALILIVTAGAQLQQSGGPGSSVTATQSGTWNVNNISGTVSLPTGAATAAKQPALGTAGSASADVLSVQGVASMTALKVDGSGVTQPVSGTFWQATQPVSGTVSVNALAAGSNFIGYTGGVNKCSATPTIYESGLAMVPNASTQVTATATCLFAIELNNTDTAAHTITVQDQSTNCNSGACQILSAFSIPASSQMRIPLDGTKFTGGFKHQADVANKIVVNYLGVQ